MHAHTFPCPVDSSANSLLLFHVSLLLCSLKVTGCVPCELSKCLPILHPDQVASHSDMARVSMLNEVNIKYCKTISLYSLVQWNWFSDVTDACNSGASIDHREPTSLHQDVHAMHMQRWNIFSFLFLILLKVLTSHLLFKWQFLWKDYLWTNTPQKPTVVTTPGKAWTMRHWFS